MRRILVVDDNEDILDVIKLILEDFDYEVTTLSNAKLLFDTVRATHPDLILLDVMLGNADGRELCHAIKSESDTKFIPVILVSASHNISERFKINSLAADDFLAKPFNITELLDIVQAHVTAA
jgi:DNA-binding response OmpR family regulator